MVYKDKDDLFQKGIVKQKDNRIEIKDLEAFIGKIVDNLVDTIVLSDSDYIKGLCYMIVKEAAHQFNVILSSIHSLYEARARDGLTHFTVPAINLRTLTYDKAKAVFRAAKKLDVGAFIFEIARSEMDYTKQEAQDYSSCILLAAIKERYSGPVFIQGDHFQVKVRNFFQDREGEINQLRKLITDAIKTGFYNIDIDSSTLVDLSQRTIDKQQRFNYETCAELTQFIRKLEPERIDISVGGEIGEVGGKNSTAGELRAFMEGYNSLMKGHKGLSKISIQTGTTHGGVILPDGSISKVKIDFDTLKELSRIAREEFKMAGAVQHGASTLPKEAFNRFPEVECVEIHLATQFQNIVYDNLPLDLKDKMYAWLHKNYANEKKPQETENQFLYKTRKKALGRFKKDIHSLPLDLKDKISSILEKEFLFLFDRLNVKNTGKLVSKYIKPVYVE